MSSKLDVRLGNYKDLIKSIPDKSVKAVITDPPYNKLGNHKIEQFFNLKQDWNHFLQEAHRVLKDDGFLIYFGAEPTLAYCNYHTYIKDKPLFSFVCDVIWDKLAHTNIFSTPLKSHEHIIIVRKSNIKPAPKLNKVKVPYEMVYFGRDIYKYEKSVVNQAQYTRAFIVKNYHKGLDFLLQAIKDFTTKYAEERRNFTQLFNEKAGGIVICQTSKSAMAAPLFSAQLKSVWSCPVDSTNQFTLIKHPTVKPVRIIEYLIKFSTNEKDTVLDPFMGSGSTGIACLNTNRNFIGFEILEEYFDLSNERLKAA